MTISCIIIEDEPLAMARAKDFVQKVPFLQLLQTFDNGMDALVYLKSEKVDLFFLDIQMDEFSGIHLLESFQQRPAVIITTAFNQYAIKGFELSVADYLLKPYTFERFMQAVIKVYDAIRQIKISVANFIFIKTEYRLEKIMLNDILFIEGMRDYRQIHTKEKKIMTLETFKDLEQKLPSNQFVRVHKSYLVALDKIELIERDRIKIVAAFIPISESFKEHFYKHIAK
ncbi:MAG: LytTR family DNA-binding domain-containing protein [Flavobacterium sp.]|nr:LytTR family DNA-binding domain-containing protein [Flavobacterium sp.]